MLHKHGFFDIAHQSCTYLGKERSTTLGPCIIFDKSALECLNVDEAVWLDHFFICNVTPLFYVESLADLEKYSEDGRTNEKRVVDLSKKTPDNGNCNIAHYSLILQDYLGNHFPMDNRPIIGGGETRIDPDGKIGVYHDRFPEYEAFSRWQEGKFHEIEQSFAAGWRKTVSNLNFDSTIGILKNTVPIGRNISDICALKAFADDFINGNYKELITLSLDILGMPIRFYEPILSRWDREKRPSLAVFAPYAAFCFKIDLFFYLALQKSFISKHRPSNKIDISYLYYLPFCDIFTSKDGLHRRIAPLFMEQGQSFIWAEDLKASLQAIDQEFSKLPEEVKIQGVYRIASYPPDNITTVVSDMWDKYCGLWRKHKSKKAEEEPRDPEKDKELIDLLNKQQKNSIPVPQNFNPGTNEPDHIMFTRKVRMRKGKWAIMPPEVIKKTEEEI